MIRALLVIGVAFVFAGCPCSGGDPVDIVNGLYAPAETIDPAIDLPVSSGEGVTVRIDRQAGIVEILYTLEGTPVTERWAIS